MREHRRIIFTKCLKKLVKVTSSGLSEETERRISTDFVRASIIAPFKRPELKICDDFKIKHENESGDIGDNDESSDSNERNENREKLVADVRCPLCPIKRINVFHKQSGKNVYLWNTNKWSRHLKDVHKLVDKTEDIDNNREKKYQDLIAANDETWPVFESSSNQNIKYKLEKVIKNEIQENNSSANRTKKSKKLRHETKIDFVPEEHPVNKSDSNDGGEEVTYGNDILGKLLLDTLTTVLSSTASNSALVQPNGQPSMKKVTNRDGRTIVSYERKLNFPNESNSESKAPNHLQFLGLVSYSDSSEDSHFA